MIFKKILVLFSLFTTVLSSIIDNNLVTLNILVRQNNVDLLEQELYTISDPYSSRYGDYYSNEEVNDLVYSDQLSKNEIIVWLRDNDIVEEIYEYSDVIRLQTSMGNVNNLLQFDNSTIRIPEFLFDKIDLLLVTKPKSKKQIHKYNFPTDNDNYIAVESILSLYNVTNYSYGKNATTSQAIAEFQNDACVNQDDTNQFTQLNNLQKLTINPNNVVGECDFNTGFPDVEASLDLQYQWGLNDNAEQYYISVPEWMYDFGFLVNQMKTPPDVISMSWGWAEYQQCTPDVFPQCYISTSPEKYSERTNTEFMKLAAKGVTLVASSGDAGAPGRTNEICDLDDSNHTLNPVFPTSSPWVTSVGGTYVFNNTVINNPKSDICKQNKCIQKGLEHNTNMDTVGWTSGGGISNYFQRPKWQDKVANEYFSSNVTKPTQSMYNKNGRIYPDVSLVAHNYLVVNMQNMITVDGTSASSPAFSGMISRLNSLRKSLGKPLLGAVNQLLYTMYNDCKNCFVDIEIGSNNATENVGTTDCKYGYTATKGFDPVYGLGLPNFKAMEEFIRKL